LRELSRELAVAEDDRAAQEAFALADVVVRDAPERDREHRERERDEEDAASDFEERKDVKEEEEDDGAEEDAANDATVDSARVARRAEIVEAGVIERRLHDERDEERFFRDVRVAQAFVQPESHRARHDDEHGHERPLEDEEEKTSRGAKELDHT